MRNTILAAIFLSIFAFAPIASADSVTVWTLNDFTFSDGATASGSFDYDAATNTFSAIHIVTTGTGVFPGAIYTAVDPGFGPFPFDVAFVTAPGSSNYTGTPALELNFVASLTNAGGSVGTDINEFVCTNSVCSAATDIRGTLDGGTVTGAPAPEPSVSLLLSAGLLSLFSLAKKPAK